MGGVQSKYDDLSRAIRTNTDAVAKAKKILIDNPNDAKKILEMSDRDGTILHTACREGGSSEALKIVLDCIRRAGGDEYLKQQLQKGDISMSTPLACLCNNIFVMQHDMQSRTRRDSKKDMCQVLCTVMVKLDNDNELFKSQYTSLNENQKKKLTGYGIDENYCKTFIDSVLS